MLLTINVLIVIKDQLSNDYGMIVHPLLFSIVDITKDNGFGEVTEKKNILINDTLDESVMATVRHGNGRDWWILVPKFAESPYFRILLNENGLQVIGKQTIGNACTFNEGGKSVFPQMANGLQEAKILLLLLPFDLNYTNLIAALAY